MKHNHALCLKPAERPSTITNILSKWHFDFPRTHAVDMMKTHYQCFRSRGNQSALETANAIIAATAQPERAEQINGLICILRALAGGQGYAGINVFDAGDDNSDWALQVNLERDGLQFGRKDITEAELRRIINDLLDQRGKSS